MKFRNSTIWHQLISAYHLEWSVRWSPFPVFVLFFKQKTAYEMRISDWSSDACSSDLRSGRTVATKERGSLKRLTEKSATFSPWDAITSVDVVYSTFVI